MISEGSAYLDRSGRVLVSDAGFRSLLGLPEDDPGEALRQRSGADPALARLLAGSGPDALWLTASGSTPACEVSRIASGDGMLLRVRVGAGALPAPALELAMQAVGLARLAGGVAHDVKNPLNAMVLQLALLGDKIDGADQALASACAGNLGSLRNQIGRINEVVRRYVEIADPAPAAGFDAGSLLTDTVDLFGHEARRRQIALACEVGPGAVRVTGDQARASRLILGLLWRAVTGTPRGGRLLARAVQSGAEAVLAVEHTRGDADPALAWIGSIMAAGAEDMGGRLEESYRDGTVRAALVLPRERTL